MPDWSSADTADKVLRYLRENADDSGRCAASFPGLGVALNIGRTTAARAVRRLCDHGELVVTRLGTGDRYPSHYRVTRLAGAAPEPLSMAG